MRRGKSLEDQIEQLKDQKAGFDAQAQAAKTQKTLIGNLAELPTRPRRRRRQGHRRAATTGRRFSPSLPKRPADASKLGLDAKQKIRDIDRKVADLENQLQSLAPAKTRADRGYGSRHRAEPARCRSDDPLPGAGCALGANLRRASANGIENRAAETEPCASCRDHPEVGRELGQCRPGAFDGAAIRWVVGSASSRRSSSTTNNNRGPLPWPRRAPVWLHRSVK